MGQLRLDEVFRSSRITDPSVTHIDGYPNIHHATASGVLPQIQLSKGINPIAKVRAVGGPRRPALLIRSSPLKAGSAETPWHDVFDLENGHVRYFGDHRVEHTVPVGTTPGNAALLETWACHRAMTEQERCSAPPLLLFRTVPRNNARKGYVEFCGLAVIERIEQIEQEQDGRPYPNYRYDLAVLDLSNEGDRLDWAWIEARGDRDLSASQALAGAPLSWRQWVEHGNAVLPDVLRSAPAGSPSEDGPTDERKQGELTPRMLLRKLKTLRVHQQDGVKSRHKPLALLWSIAQVVHGKPRLSPWRTFREDVGELLGEFGSLHSSRTPEYPFWHLRTSGLWELHGGPLGNSGSVGSSTLDKTNPTAGLSSDAAQLLEDPFLRSQAIAVIKETYLADVDQHALMQRLGLPGYDTASGVEASIADLISRAPAERRDTTVSKIVRDTPMVRRAKKMHADHCQVCGIQLATRFGTYSEGAHIRGLGRPHDGPDELANLLVLCPNHHVQFDALAIYVDAADVVRYTADDGPIGELRRIPGHPIEEAHLRYHRALCGRDTPSEEKQPKEMPKQRTSEQLIVPGPSSQA
ncbi:HNH endonuclease [Streptomyces sp. NPDC090119]|uniref:HNH endonuclease n=1 Tax=Streptomyces sp. NPDC090119 TaxID=3365951 RepID=UPI0038243C6F